MCVFTLFNMPCKRHVYWGFELYYILMKYINLYTNVSVHQVLHSIHDKSKTSHVLRRNIKLKFGYI
jgi:hypothetical protein